MTRETKCQMTTWYVQCEWKCVSHAYLEANSNGGGGFSDP